MLLGKVVDGDGHILEPPALWQQYLEVKYKDRAIRMEKDQAGVEYLVIDGRPSARLRGLGPAVASLPAGIQQKILGDNAAEAYQLSRSASKNHIHLCGRNELDGGAAAQPLSHTRLQTVGGLLWQSSACSFFPVLTPRTRSSCWKRWALTLL